MPGKITAHQVALRAGVSQSAVSRVFTPGASASVKTTHKVKRAASELGYRPNGLARAMVSGKSRIIGLVVAYLDNYFYPSALEKLSNILQKRGYHVLIFMTSHTAVNIDDVMEEILGYQVDGIILASVALSSEISSRCRVANVPIVLFNRSQDIDGISSVTSDNYAGGARVAKFLCAGNHQKIAYIAGWQGASTQRDREAGFCDTLNRLGKTLFAHGIGNYQSAATEIAVRKMFDVAADKRPDAVFVANDHMAMTAMDILRFDLGLRIPEDVSIVGYDDVPPASWLSYNLTTIRQRANLMVEQTVDILLQQISQPKNYESKQIQIDGALVIRNSAKIPPTIQKEKP